MPIVSAHFRSLFLPHDTPCYSSGVSHWVVGSDVPGTAGATLPRRADNILNTNVSNTVYDIESNKSRNKLSLFQLTTCLNISYSIVQCISSVYQTPVRSKCWAHCIAVCVPRVTDMRLLLWTSVPVMDMAKVTTLRG